MTRPDLTVRGAGIFGLSIAYEAARRGARVRVIETVGIGAGASGGIVGALSPHVPDQWNDKKAFQLDSLLMAQEFWAGVSDASALPTGYARLGRLQPLADEAAVDLARTRTGGAAALWQGRAEWRVIKAQGKAWQPTSPTGWLVEDTLSARLHPLLACKALATAIEALGGEVILGEGVAQGPEIWATGYDGLEALNHDLGRKVGSGVKGQALLLGYGAHDQPQLFVDGLHIIPHADGTVAIGSTSESSWTDATGFDALGHALHARALAALPELKDAPILGTWAGVRPRAKSRAPMLGAWPGREGVFIANGGFKIGFGMAPKVAVVMVDLVLNGRDTIPEGFRVGAS